MGWPSMRAWTWMATLAVEVSFLLFLLLTSVCVYRPASRDALTYSSLLAGVLMGAASIVTHPFVPEVCLIKFNSDVENANCAPGCPAWLVWTTSGRANPTASKPMDSFLITRFIGSSERQAANMGTR